MLRQAVLRPGGTTLPGGAQEPWKDAADPAGRGCARLLPFCSLKSP